MKITLTERQSNRHEQQDGTGEPRVARTFLDAHNVTVVHTGIRILVPRRAAARVALSVLLVRFRDLKRAPSLSPTHILSLSLSLSIARSLAPI